MSTPSTQSTIFPTAWAETLDGIQEALRQAILLAEEREAMLEKPPATDRPLVESAFWNEKMQQFDERLAAIQTSGQRTEVAVIAADEALAACETQVREWLTSATASRQRLAEWAERP